MNRSENSKDKMFAAWDEEQKMNACPETVEGTLLFERTENKGEVPYQNVIDQRMTLKNCPYLIWEHLDKMLSYTDFSLVRQKKI